MGYRPRQETAAGFLYHHPHHTHGLEWVGQGAVGAFRKAPGPASEEAQSALFSSSHSVGSEAKPFSTHKTQAPAGQSQVGEKNVSG